MVLMQPDKYFDFVFNIPKKSLSHSFLSRAVYFFVNILPFFGCINTLSIFFFVLLFIIIITARSENMCHKKALCLHSLLFVEKTVYFAAYTHKNHMRVCIFVKKTSLLTTQTRTSHDKEKHSRVLCANLRLNLLAFICAHNGGGFI